MIEVKLTATQMERLVDCGYIDVGQIRISLTHGADKKIVECINLIRMRVLERQPNG
jgi:hypothetical protein